MVVSGCRGSWQWQGAVRNPPPQQALPEQRSKTVSYNVAGPHTNPQTLQTQHTQHACSQRYPYRAGHARTALCTEYAHLAVDAA